MNLKKPLAACTALIAIALFVVLVPVRNAEASQVFHFYSRSSTPYQSNYSFKNVSYNNFNFFNSNSTGTTSQNNNGAQQQTNPSTPTTTPSQPNNPAPAQPAPAQPVPTYSQSGYEQQVVDLVNAERAKAGLSPLSVDPQLANVARLKARDMRDNNYFSHTSPTYGSPFEMMRKYGITYRYAGENIAAGQKTPEQVVQAWMNSSGHRANILNKNYTYIGVGFASGGTYGSYWAQEFIGK